MFEDFTDEFSGRRDSGGRECRFDTGGRRMCEDFADGLHYGGNFMCVQVGLELVFKSS